jgi:hypothetical protein
VAALLRALARRDPGGSSSGASGIDAPLAALCPPATIIDKTRYSAFADPGLIYPETIRVSASRRRRWGYKDRR